jgi:hypothetical protein
VQQSDIKPSENYWRDARILNRPLILDGDEYLITRSVVYLANQILVERLSCCRIPKEEAHTEVLQLALGKWSNQEGERFRQRLVSALQERRWEADDEVDRLENVAMPKEGMGPIDIIALNRTRKHIMLVEAKRNYFSRSPKDVLTELDNCFGKGKKKGEFQRFAEKIRWVNEHTDQLAEKYRIDGIANWTMTPILVSSDALKCASLKKPTFDVMTELEFTKWLVAHS